MKNDTFANRLKKAMEMNNFKQIDLVNKTKIDKTLINKYLKGISEAKQDNLTLLAEALGVDEVWLMGYDIPIKIDKSDNKLNIFLSKIDYYNIEDLVKKDSKHTLITYINDYDLLLLLNSNNIKIIKEADVNNDYLFNLVKEVDALIKDKDNYEIPMRVQKVNGQLIKLFEKELPKAKKNKFLSMINKYYTQDEILNEITKRNIFEVKSNDDNTITRQEEKRKLIAEGLKKLFDELTSENKMEDKNEN